MARLRRFVRGFLLPSAVLALAGCGMFYDLQPHRMSRLNRTPKWTGDPYNFSVPDPLPEHEPLIPSGEDP